MVQIHNNVGGIDGLHLATDCFTEEVERRIFESIDESKYQPGKRTWGGQPTGLIRWPNDWPDDYTKLSNLVRDCGLLSDYVTPNYCLRLMYPPSAGFQLHHDSKYRWGEVIVGVNLGQDGEMMFTPDKEEDAFDETAFTSELAYKKAGRNKSVRVKLPRRSIYVMSGPSRYIYKHGIAQQKPSLPPPLWNEMNIRKSLTFRSTKVFSDVYLERQLQNEKDMMKKAKLQARKDAQDKYKPNGTVEEVAQERVNAQALLNAIDSGIIPSQLRFRQSEITFPLPPGIGVMEGGAQQRTSWSRAFGAFQGEGRRLGSVTTTAAASENENDMMQMAINASLRSFTEERAARSEKRKRERGYNGASKGEDDINNWDEKKEDEVDNNKKRNRNDGVIVID
jgi:alkylated DNA repair dioxygenase AlkB